MERLTKRYTDGQAMMDCEKCKADWTGKHGKPMVDCTALYCRNRLKDRLAAYEDTGLTPEEVLPKDKADEIALKPMRLADLESLRLIDADALMDVIRQHEYRLATKQGSIDYGMFTLGIQQAVDEQPTVDAVPVVRCRDCKHAWIHPCGYVYCHRDGRNAYEMTFNLDSFCSYGKRKKVMDDGC